MTPTVTETETEREDRRRATARSASRASSRTRNERAAADQDAHRAAEQAEHDRLDQELAEDVARAARRRPCAGRSRGSLRHGDEHDVHDPDAADDQRDQGHAEEQARDQADGRLDGLDDLGEVADGEVVDLARRRSGAARAGARVIWSIAARDLVGRASSGRGSSRRWRTARAGANRPAWIGRGDREQRRAGAGVAASAAG